MALELNERLRAAADEATADIRLEHPGAASHGAGGEGTEAGRSRRRWAVSALLVAASMALVAGVLVVRGNEHDTRTTPASGIGYIVDDETALLHRLLNSSWTGTVVATGTTEPVNRRVTWSPPRSEYRDGGAGADHWVVDGDHRYYEQGGGRWSYWRDNGRYIVDGLVGLALDLPCWTRTSTGFDGGRSCEGRASVESSLTTTTVAAPTPTFLNVAPTEADRATGATIDAPSGQLKRLTVDIASPATAASPAMAVTYTLTIDSVTAPTISVPTPDQTEPAAIAIGQLIPTRLPGPLGAALEQQSTRLLLVSAPWCPHCQVALDRLEARIAAGEVRPETVLVFVSAIRAGDDLQQYDRLAAAGVRVIRDSTWNPGPDSGSGTSAALDALGLNSFPTAVSIDPTGMVTDLVTGEDDVLAAVNALPHR